MEHKLFAETRGAEAQRKKQSQIVQKMQSDLEQLKRDNAKRLKVMAERRMGGKQRGGGGEESMGKNTSTIMNNQIIQCLVTHLTQHIVMILHT